MQIKVLPIGSIDRDILEGLSEGLKKIFPWSVGIGEAVLLPEGSYNTRRGQYESSKILERLKVLKTRESELILGVTDVDLYVPKLNFVFGEADTLSGVVIISLTRLRQEYPFFDSTDNVRCCSSSIPLRQMQGFDCGINHDIIY